MYAIVDIETTGGFAGKHKITEVAIYIHDGESIVDSYVTLINPQQIIPEYITGLTGITNDMVATAPVFKEVAQAIHHLIKDKVFVAHNVHFDYSFLKTALEEAGLELGPKRLCTVRLSRGIFPGLRSYSLGNLCEQLEIPIKNRHRAAGDAEATAILFEKLLNENAEFVQIALHKGSKETTLPPNLPKQEFNALPESPGVYYFLNDKGEVIYVGKAVNIKRRISGHFSGRSKDPRNQYIRNEVHHIQYELTGNELLALVLESQEIKRLWPKYNRSQKYVQNQWTLYRYEDRLGYQHINVGKLMKGMQGLIVFNTHADAWHFLIAKAKEYDLCPRLCGIHKTTERCYDLDEGNCKGACIGAEEPGIYNHRVQELIETLSTDDHSYAIVGTGRYLDENSVILVEKGAYKGFGFCHQRLGIKHLDQVKTIVEHYKTTVEIDRYLQSYINSPEAEVITLE
ncbi:DNA polymerase III subunit epsilon [Fulvivirga sp. M361]|uniref:exonuclease domain-containing protein n=1 Tax=Fulvivirga sp. M361 TaxID=2594266 RepID=UPI00117B5316|nr:exonuclease domain-containing protein [Fulvivirga sp. M361]TRX61452.1 DNA polymerase III subunit epsilon [Fulvivirga sp. M361]